MNFITFPVGSTNIFPQVNSKTGGQLLTEFNLIAREGVATSSQVLYHIGPSYVHSEMILKYEYIRIVQEQ